MLLLLKWVSPQAPSTLHFAHQSSFPSHFLQLLNVNIILRVLACRGFHTVLPAHWATGCYFRNHIQLFLLETAHLCTHVKGKKWPTNKITGNFALHLGLARTYFRDYWGSEHSCSQKWQIYGQIPKAIFPLPCVSVVTHYSHTQDLKGTCKDTWLHFSKFSIALLLDKILVTEWNCDEILASLWILWA